LSIASGEKAATCIANCFPKSNISFFGFVVSMLNNTPNFPTFFLSEECVYEKFIDLSFPMKALLLKVIFSFHIVNLSFGISSDHIFSKS